MPSRCKVGDSACLYDGGGGHRHVVLTNPNKDDSVVIVNFTSAPNCMCDGRVFTRSDNRNLFNRPTVVNYYLARIRSVTSLCEHLELGRGFIVTKPKFCPQAITEQIIENAFKSQFTIGDVIEELKIHYPLEYGQYYED